MIKTLYRFQSISDFNHYLTHKEFSCNDHFITYESAGSSWGIGYYFSFFSFYKKKYPFFRLIYDCYNDRGAALSAIYHKVPFIYFSDTLESEKKLLSIAQQNNLQFYNKAALRKTYSAIIDLPSIEI